MIDDLNLVDDLMDDIQSFASAWSLMGHRTLDPGDAEEQKAALRKRLEGLFSDSFISSLEPSPTQSFVTYDKYGGVSVDLAAYLQTPEGRAQLDSLGEIRND